MSGVHRVPAIEFRHRTEMHEPVHLDGFPQVSRSMGGHPTTHVSNLLQFGLALRVLFFGSHLLCQLCMTFCKEDGGIARDGHRLQLLLFVGCLRIVDIVELADALLYTSLHVKQSLTIHLPVHRRMTCGTLLHKLREHAGMVGFLPLLRHVVENTFSLRFALPIGNHLTLIGVDVLL